MGETKIREDTMPITFEEVTQTVLNLVRQAEELKLELKQVKDENTKLKKLNVRLPDGEN